MTNIFKVENSFTPKFKKFQPRTHRGGGDEETLFISFRPHPPSHAWWQPWGPKAPPSHRVKPSPCSTCPKVSGPCAARAAGATACRTDGAPSPGPRSVNQTQCPTRSPGTRSPLGAGSRAPQDRSTSVPWGGGLPGGQGPRSPWMEAGDPRTPSQAALWGLGMQGGLYAGIRVLEIWVQSSPSVRAAQHGGGWETAGTGLPPHTPPRPRGGCRGLWKLWVTGRGLIRAGRRGPYPGTRPTSPGAPSLPIPLRAKGRQNIPGLPGRGCVSAELHTRASNRP